MSNLKKHKDRKGNSLPHLYIHQSTKEFWAVLRIRGVLRRKNLATTEYTVALARLPQALSELGSEKFSARAKKIGPNKLLCDYWADLVREKRSREIAEATLIRMDTVWRWHLEPYLGHWRADQVKPDMIPDFVLWHKKTKGTQLVNVFKYLGNLFGFMVRVGALQVPQVPLIELSMKEKKHHDTKKGRIVTAEEKVKLLNHGDQATRLVIGVAEALGTRKMEIVSLKREFVKIDAGRYFFDLPNTHTKTGLARILPIPNHLSQLVRDQMTETDGAVYLFPREDRKTHIASQVFDRKWLAVKKAAEISGRLKMHDWRHTRATLMAKQNVNPVIACTILGMTIKTYQEKYLNLSAQDLMNTVDKMMLLGEGDAP